MDGVSSYRRYLQGDRNAIGELVQTYGDQLVRYAFCYVKNAAEAEDIMEDTFAVLLAKRKKFESEEAFRCWLFKVARNKSYDYLRSARSRYVPISDFENVLTAADAEREFFRRETDRKVYEQLFTLREDYREALYLTYFNGFSAEEVQRALGKTRKQVYNLLARAKAALREILEKEGICYAE